MHIHLEKNPQNAIQSYSDDRVLINQMTYQDNLIVSRDLLISPWNGPTEHSLSLVDLEPILDLKPELIIIGHHAMSFKLTPPVRARLLDLKIGIECMNLGAACRTFNVLLSEDRNVVLAIIF